MTDLPISPRSVPSQMGGQLRRTDDVVDCWIEVTPEMCTHGVVRAACLIMTIDVGAGYVAECHADDDWTFTVDIGLRRQPVSTDRLEGRPVVQRAGRTISIDLPLRDDRGRASAAGVSTFIRLPRRPQDPPRVDFPIEHMHQSHPPEDRLEVLLDARPTEHGLAVELRPELLNPAGILQGGVASLLAELAAERVLAGGRRIVVSSFDVRYVTMGRVGPIEAVVEPIGARMAAVRLLDRGADDAVVTHNLIGFDEV